MWLRLFRSYGNRTGHAVIRFPLLDLLVQGLKRLFDGTVFIDAVDGVSRKDIPSVPPQSCRVCSNRRIAIRANNMLRRFCFPHLHGSITGPDAVTLTGFGNLYAHG